MGLMRSLSLYFVALVYIDTLKQIIKKKKLLLLLHLVGASKICISAVYL